MQIVLHRTFQGYTGEDEYIACQGPKEETTYDFWRMIDQYNISVIVMLTQLVEKGKVNSPIVNIIHTMLFPSHIDPLLFQEKCHQYYPIIKETFRYENMTIRCTSEFDFRTHIQRTLVLQKVRCFCINIFIIEKNFYAQRVYITQIINEITGE